MSRSFGQTYDAGENTNFLNLNFKKMEDWKKALRSASARSCSIVAIEEISKDKLSESQQKNLEKLSQGNCVAVITGQQTGLFGGPVFTFLKASYVIWLSRYIEKNFNVQAVPCFWLQSEDHDLEEISWASVLTPTGMFRSTLDTSSANRISVQHYKLPNNITDILNTLLSKIPIIDKELEHALREAYSPGRSIVDAFKSLINFIYQDDGLLIFNPRVESIQASLHPHYLQALNEHGIFIQALQTQTDLLRKEGFEVQVSVQNDVALPFFHTDGKFGPRYRLRTTPDKNIFEITERDQRITIDEIKKILSKDPLAISTSALLRPLIQDTLFPTAVYVGGLAEISYFAQITTLYKEFNLAQPLVIPRPSAIVGSSQQFEKLAALNLVPEDLLKDLKTIKVKASRLNSSESIRGDLVELWTDSLNKVLANLPSHVRDDVGSSIKQTQKNIRFIAERFERRVGLSEMRTDIERTNLLKEVLTFLKPNKEVQERAISGIFPFLQNGMLKFKAEMYNRFSFSPQPILKLNSD